MDLNHSLTYSIPMSHTGTGRIVDTTRSESKEVGRVIGIASSGIAKTRHCMVREGGAEMNVVAIEAMRLDGRHGYLTAL